MPDTKKIITEFELPEWIEQALESRSRLHNVDIGAYALEILAAHFEGRAFDATKLRKGGV